PTPSTYPHNLHDALPICSIQIQKLRLSAGEDSVRLTKIEACTGRSESPATAGMDATRTRHTAKMSGRHARNRRGVSWARIIDSTDRKSTRLNSSHVSISY